MKLLKIKSIKYEKKQCSDITVNNNHNFFCNNILIHNCDYRGEIKVALTLLHGYQLRPPTYEIKMYDRVAQILFEKAENTNVEFVETYDELSTTERGVGGFGSSGK